MQWRPLLILICGVAMVYLASLLQETPYPHPLKVYTADTTRWRYTPDDTILSTVDGYLYLTAFWFEVSPKGRKSVLHGIGPLKTGVVGRVTQLRRPLHTLLDQDPSISDANGWTLVFEHELDGAISKLSEAPYSDDPLQFAAMYYVVENETVKHYARLYYIRYQDDQPPVFEYKNVLLPGSTRITSFNLEKDSILYSRDPDIYRFRMISLPDDLTLPPHSSAASTIALGQNEPGDEIRKNILKEDIEEHAGVLCRIFSPVNDTFRLVSLDVHQTEHALYANVYMVDNASTATQLSELRGENVSGKWYLREHLHKEHEVFTDDSMEYIGFADVSQFQHVQKISLPRLSMVRSRDARTIVFPYVQTSFITVDYTEKPNVSDGIEYYELLQDEIRSYDDTISGMQLDEKGELLAIWTEANMVYIYKRGTADMQRVTKRKPSLLDKMDLWLDVSIPDEEDDDEERIQRRKEQGLPLDWKLRMAIPLSDGDMESSHVSAARFWSTPLKENYLFTALRNGAVNSYLLDEVEEIQESEFMNFLSGRWNMLIAMMMVVLAFVFNEYQYHV